MKFFRKRLKYEFTVPASRVLSPITNALFYISIVSILLLAIISVIVFFVKVPVDDMLLPPFMKKVVDADETALYSIDFGVGFKITTLRSEVSIEDIKAVIYSFILLIISSLIMLAPIFKFLSRFFKNIGERNLFSEDNARMMNRVGVSVVLGNILTGLASQFYLYTLANTFLVVDAKILKMSLSYDWKSLVVGSFIIFLGSVYGCASEAYRNKQFESSDLIQIP